MEEAMPEDWANPIPRESLADGAFVALRQALMRGQIAPGEKLRLRPLSRRFAISATPMREALLRLASTGALAMDERGTVVVPRLTRSQLLEIRAIRLDLEGRAAAAAAERAETAAIDGLQAIQDRIAACHVERRFVDAVDLNTQFHLTLCGAGGMPILLGIVETLWVRCGPILSHLYDDGNPHTVPHPHLRVIDALRARNAAAARKAIQSDIRNGGRGLFRHVEDR